jgi:NAD-dependent dihydropyrimidine dehydrogenase PreA subunit
MVPPREIVRIDDELCDGCGECIPSCAEGAIQLIDGKARLVGDALCDGLGACLGHCPKGAISVIRRDADAFDQAAVATHLASSRPIRQCPSSLPTVIGHPPTIPALGPSTPGEGLRHWPVQLHLLSPTAPFLTGVHLVLAADCCAFALPGFHGEILRGRALAIACPKLDHGQEVYVEKLASLFDDARVASLEVVIMEVPCCAGLMRLVDAALSRSTESPPVTMTVVSTGGQVVHRANP